MVKSLTAFVADRAPTLVCLQPPVAPASGVLMPLGSVVTALIYSTHTHTINKKFDYNNPIRQILLAFSFRGYRLRLLAVKRSQNVSVYQGNPPVFESAFFNITLYTKQNI